MQMLPLIFQFFSAWLWGPSYLAMFFSVHTEAFLDTAPNSTYNHLSWDQYRNLISNSLSPFSFLCSLHFTLALSLCSPLNISPNRPGWPQSSSGLYNLNRLFLCLLFTLSGSTSHLLLSFIYMDLGPLCVISRLSAGWIPLFCPQLQADISNQHRTSLIIKLDKWDSACIFFLITGRVSNNVGSNNLAVWTSLHVIYLFFPDLLQYCPTAKECKLCPHPDWV